MYRLQYHTIAGKLSEESDNEKGTCSKHIVNHTSKEVYRITRAAAELIDKYIEKHARSATSEEGARKRKNQGNDDVSYNMNS